jgi:hypothetical protein
MDLPKNPKRFKGSSRPVALTVYTLSASHLPQTRFVPPPYRLGYVPAPETRVLAQFLNRRGAVLAGQPRSRPVRKVTLQIERVSGPPKRRENRAT